MIRGKQRFELLLLIFFSWCCCICSAWYIYSGNKILDSVPQTELTEKRSNLTGMKQYRSKANMMSLKDVWWWQLKSQLVLLTSRLWQTFQGVPAISRINWTWQMEIHFRWNWRELFLSSLKSCRKPRCRQYMTGVNKEKSSDLINHSIWQQSTPREVLLFPSLEYAAPSWEDAFIFTVGLCCLCCSLPLSHPFHHLYSLTLFSLSLSISYPFHFPFINNSVPVGSTHTWEELEINTDKRAL